MQYIKNITTAGMKGRKKETKLNKIILTMVFFLFAGEVHVLNQLNLSYEIGQKITIPVL